MPEQTACQLERILSLSSKSNDAPAPGPAVMYAAPGPQMPMQEARGDQSMLSCMFFEVVDQEDDMAESSGEGEARPRFESGMSWTADYDDRTPQHAHGPGNYGAPHVDPYGPTDRDDAGPGLPPALNAGSSPGASTDTWQDEWEEEDLACARAMPEAPPTGAIGVSEHEYVASPSDCSSDAGSREETMPLAAVIPEWTYEALPRDCLVMLLQSALKHMPQEAEVVARCMKAMAPLTPEEHKLCFGTVPSQHGRGAGAAAGPAPAKHKPIVEVPGATPAAFASDQKPVYDQKSARPLEETPGGRALAGAGEQQHAAKRCRSPTAASTQSGMGSPGEIRRTINKSGVRTSIRLTDSRAGTRTSILTEEQAIQVFKQRPAQRSERASLCSELADRYSVTTTAIRHIWDRRTWVWTNIPYWTKEELAASLAEGTCDACKQAQIQKIEDTCELCPINRKRGRPRGARDTYRRQRKNP
jgi:hypothetical protein